MRVKCLAQVLVNLIIILEPREEPVIIFAKVPPVGRCAKQLTSFNIAQPVINVITLRLNAANNIRYSWFECKNLPNIRVFR